MNDLRKLAEQIAVAVKDKTKAQKATCKAEHALAVLQDRYAKAVAPKVYKLLRGYRWTWEPGGHSDVVAKIPRSDKRLLKLIRPIHERTYRCGIGDRHGAKDQYMLINISHYTEHTQLAITRAGAKLVGLTPPKTVRRNWKLVHDLLASGISDDKVLVKRLREVMKEV